MSLVRNRRYSCRTRDFYSNGMFSCARVHPTTQTYTTISNRKLVVNRDVFRSVQPSSKFDIFYATATRPRGRDDPSTTRRVYNYCIHVVSVRVSDGLRNSTFRHDVRRIPCDELRHRTARYGDLNLSNREFVCLASVNRVHVYDKRVLFVVNHRTRARTAVVSAVTIYDIYKILYPLRLYCCRDPSTR